jgi:hypothetical protein
MWPSSDVSVEEGWLEPGTKHLHEQIKVDSAPESEAARAGELHGRYGRERDRERISWKPAIWILQALFRMGSTGDTHPFRWGAELNHALNAIKHSAAWWRDFGQNLEVVVFINKSNKLDFAAISWTFRNMNRVARMFNKIIHWGFEWREVVRPGNTTFKIKRQMLKTVSVHYLVSDWTLIVISIFTWEQMRCLISLSVHIQVWVVEWSLVRW